MYLGDYSTGSTVFFGFTTVNSSGVPTALSSGGVTVYRDGSTVPATTGVTLTASFNGVTGFNRVQVDMAGTSTFYQPGAEFTAIISSGAASENLAGYTLAHWSVIRGTPVTVSTAVSISTASLISTSNVFASVASVTGNVTGSVGSVASATGIATAVWGATRASHVAAGSFGEMVSTSTAAPDQWVSALVTGSSLVNVVEWQGVAPSTLGPNSHIQVSTAQTLLGVSTAGSVGSVTGNVTGSVGSVASATGLATAIWGATRASYVAVGSFGESISTGSSIAALTWNINSVTGAVGSVTGSVGSVASATGLALAIWGATRSAYVAAGSFGESISTGSSIASVSSGQTVTSVTTVTGNVTGSIGSLTTAAALAVNAEVVDALATDSTGAPAGAPAAAASLETKVGFLYGALRHGLRVGSSGKTFLDASSAVQWVKGLVDDGSTYAETLASTST